MNIETISADNKNYPSLLKEITTTPDPLYYRGTLPIHDTLCIGIVGTRNATEHGRTIARTIARDLAQHGITIVSGLARGIDGEAHRGALDAHGTTIAILAHGLNTIYPQEHSDLAEQIVERGGCLLSEHSPDISPAPEQFLERNRLISGMSTAVVIIESPVRSGTLNTARHALEQNRDVFVVPGPAGNRNYVGSHSLIREGARLITSANDIINDLELITEESIINNNKLIED